MAKTKKAAVKDEVSLASLRQRLKRSNKLVTKNGQVKKKVPKQFTEYQCNICYKKFTDKYNLSTHAKIHLNEEYPCNKCSYIGKTQKYLYRHKRVKHTTGKIECNICGRRFHHPSGLKEHMMVHTGEKPLKCEVCGKTFRVHYSLNSHMLIHKNEKPYKCTFCPYSCRDSSTLRKHEYRHMGLIHSYCCKFCPKKFDTKARLKQHVSDVHLDYLNIDRRIHKCQHCEKAFKFKGNLTKHIEVMHTKLPGCPCPICGKRIKHKTYLRAHLRTHFPERPHVCAYRGCGKAFKAQGDLKKHSVIHARERHAACSLCGVTFARAYRLVNHMRTHQPKEKHVVCDYCHVKFYTKNYLIKHIKQKHTENKRQFICDHCGLVSFNKPSIVMHLKYGQCQLDKLVCKICNTSYKHQNYLRSHYLKTHKMRYKPMKRKRKEVKPSIEIKMEPLDDPYEDVQLALLEVSKEEIEIDAEEEKEEEEGSTDNDLVDYSKRVLSEDLQCLLDGASTENADDGFDEFLLSHVFHRQVKEEEPKMVETDEEQVASVTQKIKEVMQKAKEDEEKKMLERKERKKAKLLEKKLKREAKIMRRKGRRERFELERVRQMYNERMRKAAAAALIKEPAKKVKYFKLKTTEETNNEKETFKSKDHYIKDLNSNSNTDSDKNTCQKGFPSDTSKDISSPNIKNTEKDHLTAELVNISNNNEAVEDTLNSEHNNNKVVSTEKELIEANETNDDLNANYDFNVNYDLNIHDDVNTNDEIHINERLNGINSKNSVANDKQNSVDAVNISRKEQSVKNNTVNKSNDNDHLNDRNNVINDIDNANDKDMNSKLDDMSKNCHRVNANDKDVNSKLNDTGKNDNNKVTDDENDDSDNDKSESDSDYNPESEDETAPSKKMKFQTFQCYICFKLYSTKEELMSHCATHFDICNSTTLSKCPACGHVVSRNIAKHMRVKHDIRITISHSKISTRDEGEGSKYCYKMADTVMEIIPSVKMLNHSAAVELDRRARERRDRTVAKTRLVRRGAEWVVEKYCADISYQEMPEFSSRELSEVPVSEGDVERLGRLGRLARRRGARILYPCQHCDKICQNFCALKLHVRRHDPNKKPFAPRKWKRDVKTDTDIPKVKNMENRSAKPQPIKNKHKCDEKLKKFYETHIRGADIEFWQFLKIYNKMDRDDIKDFTDLANRSDFGKQIYGESCNTDETSSKTAQHSDHSAILSTRKINDKNNAKSKIVQLNGKLKTSTIQQKFTSTLEHRSVKKGRTSSKLDQPLKKSYKRVIMIGKKQHMEREKLKNMLREKNRSNL